MKQWIIDRLQERSTWLGLTALATAAGVTLSPELQNAVITIGLALAGFIATVTKG